MSELGPKATSSIRLRIRRLFDKPWPLRVALAALALGAMLPTLIFFALEYRAAMRGKEVEIQQAGRALASNLAQDVEREIAVKHAQLSALATSFTIQAGDYAGFYQQARASTKNIPGRIVLFRSDGAILFNTQVPYGTKLPQAQISDLVRRVADSGQPETSDVFWRPHFNDYAVSFLVPIGSTGLVLGGSIPLDSLSEHLRRQTPEGWVCLLIDRQGKVVARSRRADQFIGTQIMWDASQANAAAEGWIASKNLEGVDSFIGWQWLSNGWSAVVSVPRATIEAPMRNWQTDVFMSLLVFFGLAFISAMLVGEWIIRSMKELAKAAAAIGAGETIKPVDFSIEEVNEVGKALAKASQDRLKGELANAHLAAIVTSSGDAIKSISLEGKILTWNPAAEELYGYSADEVIDRPLAMLIPKDRLGEIDEKIEAARAGCNLRLETVRQRKDNSLIEVSLNAAPIRSVDGTVVGISSIAHDITRRKRYEEHLEFVMRELSHRTKNLITVIIAMARRTCRQSETFNDFEHKFSGRLHGLARSHDLLVHTDWTGASIQELVQSHLDPFVEDPASVEASGPLLLVRPEAVQNLGFALHELATNAHKYGALSRLGGKVTVNWEVKENASDCFVHLSWRESGGPEVCKPEREGFGTTVIKHLTEASLNAKVRMAFRQDGFAWDVEMPIGEIVKGGAGAVNARSAAGAGIERQKC